MNARRKTALWLVFAVYLAVLLRITVLRSDFGTHDFCSGTVIWVPFVSLYEILQNSLWRFIYLFAGNLVWFWPLGFLMPLLTPLRKSVMLLGAGFSILIEVLQFIFATGVSEVEDVILNTLGCCIGYGCYGILLNLKATK